MKVYRVESTLSRVAESSFDGRSAADPESVSRVVRDFIGDDPRENFVAAYLDQKHRVVAVDVVSIGTINQTQVHPREVFGPALRLRTVAAIIVAHNHPSGDPTPSQPDADVPKRLVECGRLLGLPVLDHVILGDDGRHHSLRKSRPDLF